MTRPPMHRIFLWGAMVCALGASWAHVAQAFGQLERGGAPAWISRAGPASAVLAAVGLDLGMMGLAWAVAARRRMGKPARDLWATVAVFAALSSFANLDAALRVLLGNRRGTGPLESGAGRPTRRRAAAPGAGAGAGGGS